MTRLIDTHCHLTRLNDAEVQGVIDRANARGVDRMICIGASKGEAELVRALEIALRFEPVYATFGIHPHDAGEYESLDPVLHHWPKADVGDGVTNNGIPSGSGKKIVAVGETGLDFFRDWSPFDKQYLLFESSVALAHERSMPLVIHSRAADAQTINFLQERRTQLHGGVFHCFSGSYEYAQKILDLGFCISVTGTVTFKNALALRETIGRVPLDRLMVETDSPYMAPEPYRGTDSEPQHVFEVAKKIAEVKGISFEEVADVTTRTAERLFRLA